MRFVDLKNWLNFECYHILEEIANMKKYTIDPWEIQQHFNVYDLKRLLYLETVRLYSLEQKMKLSNLEVIDIIRIDNFDELFRDYRYFMNEITKVEYYHCVEFVDLLN